MKKIKISLAFILFLSFAVFQNEQYFFYLMKFSNQLTYVQLFYDAYTKEHPNAKETDMTLDIDKAALEHDVKVMAYTMENVNDREMILDIYANTDMQDVLEKEYFVSEGKYTSLFSGNINVRFHLFDEITDNNKISDMDTYYLYGNTKDMDAFKEELYEYAGCFPQKGVSLHSGEITAVIFLILSLFLVFSSVIDVLMMKKQHVLKIILGEDAFFTWAKEMITDLGTVVLAFLLFKILMKYHYQIFFYNRLINELFMGMCFLKFFAYLPLLKVNLSGVLKNGERTVLILRIGYFLRICFGIMSGVVIGLCFMVLMNGWKLYSQREYFEKYKDYDYIHLDPDMTTEEWEKEWNEKNINMSLKPSQDIYRDQFERYSATMMCSNTEFYIYKKNKRYPVITGNAHMLSSIEKKLGLKVKRDSSCIVLYPYRMDYSKIEDEINQGIKTTYGSLEGITVVHMPYHKNSWFTAINNNKDYGSEYIRNPIIVIFMEMPYEETFKPEQSSIFLYDIMYRADREDLETYAKKLGKRLGYKIKIRTENVQEHYLYYWNFVKKEIISNLFFVVFICMLSLLSLRLLIQCDKEINGRVRTLKRLFGHYYFEYNKEIILPSLLIWFVEILTSLIISFVADMQGHVAMAVGILFGMMMDFIQSVFIYAGEEKRNILQIINRGGGL